MFDDRAKARATVCVCNFEEDNFPMKIRSRDEKSGSHWVGNSVFRESLQRTYIFSIRSSASSFSRCPPTPSATQFASSPTCEASEHGNYENCGGHWIRVISERKFSPKIRKKFHWKKIKRGTESSELRNQIKWKIIKRRKRLAEIWCLFGICKFFSHLCAPQSSSRPALHISLPLL